MNARLIELCSRAIEKLFENPVLLPGTGLATLPIIGNLYIPDLETDHSEFIPMILAALVARERFRREAPGWPPLPLHENDIELLKGDDRPQIQVVGLFGDSWKYTGWDKRHPLFCDYASGLLACDYAPDEIRNDRSLQKEFPPLPLAGLCDESLHWRSPEKLAFDRQMAARKAAYEARMKL
jgi:hypothetical protein